MWRENTRFFIKNKKIFVNEPKITQPYSPADENMEENVDPIVIEVTQIVCHGNGCNSKSRINKKTKMCEPCHRHIKKAPHCCAKSWDDAKKDKHYPVICTNRNCRKIFHPSCIERKCGSSRDFYYNSDTFECLNCADFQVII